MTSSTPPFHSSSSPSSSSSVPPFHSLGNGTVEQDQSMRNTQWNAPRTNLLKALANKVLKRNKERNTVGTAASKSVPSIPQSFSACGTNGSLSVSQSIRNETLHERKYGTWMKPISLHPFSVLEDYEERLAIAEYDGQQTLTQAHRMAYLDAFISLLSDLAEDDPHQDWLAEKIQTVLATLEDQNFLTLN